MFNKIALFLIPILGLFLVLSGCISSTSDLQNAIFANSAINSFKTAHPNAQFSAVLWTDADLQTNSDKVMSICGKSLIGEYYYFNLTENNDIIEGFVTKDTYDIVCVKNYKLNSDNTNVVPQKTETVDITTSADELTIVEIGEKVNLCIGQKVVQNGHGFKFDKVYSKENGDYARIYDLESNGYMDILLKSGPYKACDDVKTFDSVIITFDSLDLKSNCGKFTFTVNKKGCETSVSATSGGQSVSTTAPNYVCKETDNGQDYYTFGTTTGYFYNAGVDAQGNTYPRKEIETFKDSCTLIVAGGETDKSTSIKEFFCNDKGLVGMYYSLCPNNGTCLNGACTKVISATECTDSDGKDLFTKGTTTGWDYYGTKKLTSSDFCAKEDNGAETKEGKFVVEELCDASNKVHAYYYECPVNTSCYDGACKKVDIVTESKLTTTIKVEGSYNSSLNYATVPSDAEVCVITDKATVIECKNLVDNKTSFNITNDYNFTIRSKDSTINSNMFAITGFGVPKKYGDRFETLIKRNGKLYLSRVDDGASMDLSQYDTTYVYVVKVI